VKVTETKRTFAGNPADIAALFNNYFTSIFTTDPNMENCSPEALPYQSNNTIIKTLPFRKPMFSPYYIISTLIKLKVQMGFLHNY
jgi:hypothetical protein